MYVYFLLCPLSISISSPSFPQTKVVFRFDPSRTTQRAEPKGQNRLNLFFSPFFIYVKINKDKKKKQQKKGKKGISIGTVNEERIERHCVRRVSVRARARVCDSLSGLEAH